MTITTRSFDPRGAKQCQPRRTRPGRHIRSRNSPRTNVQENTNEYTLFVQAPGWTKEEISLDLNGSRLNIQGKMTKEESSTASKIIRSEFSRRSFERSFILPDQANTENIEAKFENGLLIVSIPKKAENKEDELRTITIS